MSELNTKLSNYPLYTFDLTGQEMMEIVYNNQNFKIPSSKILNLIPAENTNPRVSVFTGNVNTDPSLVSDFLSKELYFMCAGSGTYTNFKREDDSVITIPNNNTLILFKKEKNSTSGTYSEISLDAMAKEAADMAIAAAIAANEATNASIAATEESIERTALTVQAIEDSETQTALALIATTNATNAANLANEKADLAQDKLDEVNLIIIDLNALILESETAIENTIIATNNANTKASLANDAAILANQKAIDAQAAVDDVNEMLGIADNVIAAAEQATSDTLIAKELTEQATTNANTATGAANSAALTANAARDNAVTATTAANNAANLANTNAVLANNAANLATEVATHPTKVINDYWHQWNTDTNAYENTGIRARGDVQYATFGIDTSTGLLSMFHDDDFQNVSFGISSGKLSVTINS